MIDRVAGDGTNDREFIGAKGKMTVKSVKQNGNEITVTADWVSNFCAGPARFVFVLPQSWPGQR